MDASACRASMIYSTILKQSNGYCVDAENEKIILLTSLIDMMEKYINENKLKIENGEYLFCGKKVLPSKYNSLLLNSDCETIEIDSCDLCFDINDVVNKVKAICKTC